MAGIKISALPAGAVPVAADLFPTVQGGVTSKVTAAQIKTFAATLSNASVASVTGYAADTYLAGSACTIPVAGGWKVGTIYQCTFNMAKTAAGIAAFNINVRMGTLGTTGDPTVVNLAFAAGTAAVDSGFFELIVVFRTVGSGTTAVVNVQCQLGHHLAATGLTSTGAAGTAIAGATSAGFNSTTQTIIGLSVNGGAAFSGTNDLVQASLLNV